jgi:serine acetyltransferase
VLENVPARAVVVGNPARVVSFAGTSELIHLGQSAPLPTGHDGTDAIAQAS